ncbi:ABC transporter substrate-binding protein [Pseudomonas frederiksbergensis]|uniref:ABC transporter substrate-binding protein n=1 Tax=Pseudomonas frederiksbergensis TaxID=104087 RepID=A0A1J0EJM7_9PSED|nr:transporter substrate-binding domain-containing protein [Pseudomonas frederiksbergensis]APC16123.1 ABC transporter substrate-binding protein [Pseudomonas frederiksbergensis]
MVGRWLWVLVFAVFCSVARAADVPTIPAVIHLASEDWDDYTAADGHGLAWDILRAVFEPAGVKLDIRTVPYTRSVGLVQRREVDALVGAYRDEADQVLYPRWNFDIDHIYALGLASNPEPTLATLGKYRLVWVRGYRYESYLPNIHRYNQIERRTGILPMLKQARADFYIDALAEIDSVLADSEDPSRYRRTHLIELPLFLGFADTPKARALMVLYDRRMELLVKSGQLKAIFEHWKQPYPFDENTRLTGQ